MKLFKNKLVIGIACIVLAALLTFVLGPLTEVVTSRNTLVVRATAPIKKGDVISTEMLETVKVGRYNLPTDIITDVNFAVGKYAACDIQGGDYLTGNKLSEDIPFADSYLSELASGKFAVSITLRSSAAGLSGKLKSGDIISVFAQPDAAAFAQEATDENGEVITAQEKKISDSYALAPKELMYVKVLAVVDSAENDISNEEKLINLTTGDNASADESTQQLIQTVILEVNYTQASLLSGLNSVNTIHCALAARYTDSDKCAYLLELQENYFKELEAAQAASQPIVPEEPPVDESEESENA